MNVSVSVPPGQVAEIVDGDLRDDDHIPVPAASRAAKIASRNSSRLPRGLEDEQVDAGVHQGVGLLAENRARFGERCGPERLDRHAERSDGAGDEGASPAASRASRTPASLIAFSFSAKPKAARRARLAPNVLVSRISAPALTYSWWICAPAAPRGSARRSSG